MQRSAKVGAPGLVNFTIAVAYHFCPGLPAEFRQPGALALVHFAFTRGPGRGGRVFRIDCRRVRILLMTDEIPQGGRGGEGAT